MNPISESDLTTERLARWSQVARDAGVKLTHQRVEIFRELAGSDAHPDADAVFRAVRARVPTVSIDTVYRTLWLLHDLGLIATVGPRREDGIRFDTNLDHHHHFVCVRCGLIRDFQSPALADLPIPAAVTAFGEALEARVEVRGVCARCQTSTPPPQGGPHE